jgi:tRNA pseudouridine32 synthase/23S rRNA pseudouridine746 synthase
MQRGELLDERGVAMAGGQPYRSGGKLYYYRSIDDEPCVPFAEEILFQDEWLVAVDKPHFLPVTPGGRHLQQTLLVRLKRRLGIDTLTPLHRLDRETAGVVVFAVQPHTRGAYQALFAQRQVVKHYEAIAPWRPDLSFPLTRRSRLVEDAHFLRMREEPGEPNAETHFELLEALGDLARYRLMPVTGRTHQLRVHCAALGLPIVGDRMYPELLPADTDDLERPLQLLNRWKWRCMGQSMRAGASGVGCTTSSARRSSRHARNLARIAASRRRSGCSVFGAGGGRAAN